MTICNPYPQKKECPKVNCRRDNCCGCPFRKVVIPAVAGDDQTGTVIPENGLFTNALVEYEANGAMYIYASDGIFTRIGSNSKSEEAASVTYVDTQILDVKRYTDQKVSSATSAMTTYVDGGDSSTLASAREYADSKAATTLTSAESYADGKDATTLQSAKDYTDAQDAITLQAAKDYTDSAASSVVTRGYVDAGDASSLESAKAYTDQEIGTLESSLATVATTGSYDDLTNAPDVPIFTLTTTDPGEGVALAANHFIGVYS